MPFLTRLHGVAGPGPKVWTLTRPMLYCCPATSTAYLCPPGQISDLASIPRLTRPLIPGNGKERQPAVLHDRAYERLGAVEVVLNPDVLPWVPDGYDPWDDADQTNNWQPTLIEEQIYRMYTYGLMVVGRSALTRSQADSLFSQAMQCSRVNWFLRQLMYNGVRTGGWVAWRNHARKQRQED